MRPVRARARRERPVARSVATRTVPGVYRRLRTNRARRRRPTVVRPTAASPRPGGPVTARFGVRNVNGVPTVLGVLGARLGRDCRPTWYRVQLPVKPNGAAGWVRAADVDVATVRTRVLVDLSERRLTLFRGGRPVFSTRAAIGSAATPTPTGAYYVNQRLVPSDPGGPFGPGAIGISAFSEVLTGWVKEGDRHPRDEPARARRAGRLERLHPRGERRPAPPLARDAGGHAGGRA